MILQLLYVTLSIQASVKVLLLCTWLLRGRSAAAQRVRHVPLDKLCLRADRGVSEAPQPPCQPGAVCVCVCDWSGLAEAGQGRGSRIYALHVTPVYTEKNLFT